jgi:hypothetical protein
MKSLIEIISHVPIKTIRIQFLNRGDIIEVTRNGVEIESPEIFQQNMYSQLDSIQARPPNGLTPVFKKLQSALNIPHGKRHRYAFLTNSIVSTSLAMVNQIHLV